MSNEHKDWYNDLKNTLEGSPDYNRYLCMEYPFLLFSFREINGLMKL